MTNIFLEHALKYAARGWYVVPDHSINNDGSCTCNDSACKVQGKHPRMERDATDSEFRGTGSIDPAQIKEWWSKWPNSNVAIVCGAPSNLVAIDLDPRNHGFNSWTLLLQEYGNIGTTITSITGGGGKHILFSHPKLETIRNRIGLRPGIDIKADKGRIVAPPSKHKSGNSYRWENYNSTLSPLPRWLYQKIQTEKGTGTWQAMRR